MTSGPKSSFQMIASFVFHLETKGPRVWRKGGEAHSPSCLESSVKFPQSVMIWGAMLFAAWSIAFLKTNVTCTRYQVFWITSCFLLLSHAFKYADFIFQQDLAPAHTCKSTKSWLRTMVLVCLTGQHTHQIWGIVKRKMRNKRQKMQMS